MLAFLNQVRKPTLDLPLEVRLPYDVPDSQEL